MNIGSNIHFSDDRARVYLEKYFPELESCIFKSPPCSFHEQLDDFLKRMNLITQEELGDIQSDLWSDEILIRNMQSLNLNTEVPIEIRSEAVAKEDFCRKVFFCATFLVPLL